MILQLCGLVDCCFGFELKCVLSPATIMAKLPTHLKPNQPNNQLKASKKCHSVKEEYK
jgi:hypothetical protein